MILSTALVAGAATAGTVGAGIKVYRERKRKREFPWAVAAERLGVAKKGVLLGRHNKQAARPAVFLGTVGREFTDKLMAPFVSQTRHEQLAEIRETEKVLEMSESEKRARRGLFLGTSGLILAAGGALFYAPLYVPSVLIMTYVFKEWPKEAYKALVEERRVGVEMILAVSLPTIVVSGFIFLGALGLWYSNVMRVILAKTENHSRNSLVNLFGQQPRFVWVLVDSVDGEGKEEVEIPFESVKAGDLVVVMAGQTIPVDGTISRGMASIDQRMLTGEAQPAQKGAEESVFAGTIVLSGKIVVRVEQAGEETLIAQIGDILNHTDDFDQAIRSRVSTLQDKTVPALFLLAGGSLPWLGLNGALAILWYAPGTRMNLFGPMSMLNFLHICSQKRIRRHASVARQRWSFIRTIE